jgi:hypothetical protein
MNTDICPGCRTCKNCDVEGMFKNKDGTQGHHWLGDEEHMWCDLCDSVKEKS